jgi:hypothetical protein
VVGLCGVDIGSSDWKLAERERWSGVGTNDARVSIQFTVVDSRSVLEF